MRIHPTPDIRTDHRHAGAGEVQRRQRQHQKQTFQGLGRLQFAGLDLEAARFIVQKGLFAERTMTSPQLDITIQATPNFSRLRMN